MINLWSPHPPPEPGFYWYIGPRFPGEITVVRVREDWTAERLGTRQLHVPMEGRGVFWGPQLVPPEPPLATLDVASLECRDGKWYRNGDTLPREQWTEEMVWMSEMTRGQRLPRGSFRAFW